MEREPPMFRRHVSEVGSKVGKAPDFARDQRRETNHRIKSSTGCVVVEESVASSSSDNRPISTIVFLIAMQTEALPLVDKFQLSEDQNSLFE
ncbi:hypothetical protein LguiA_002909 [Lonicera macranthoides]